MRKFNTSTLDLLPLIVVIMFTVISEIAYKPFNDMSSQYTKIIMNDGWTVDETGETISLNEIDKANIKISININDIDTYKYKLCFKSIHTYVTVYADDKNVYEYIPDENKLLGKSYGVYPHTVAIPDNTDKVTLELQSVFDDAVDIEELAFEDESTFLIDILKKGLADILLSAIMLVFGVSMLIIGEMNKRLDVKSYIQINFKSVGIFAILSALWAVNDTYILQMLFQKPDLIKAASYISLIFIHCLPVAFIYDMTKCKKKVIPTAIGIMTLVSLCINLVLTIGGVSDYPKLVWMSQIMIVVSLVLVAGMIFDAKKNGDIERQEFSTILLGINSMVLGAIVDLVRHKIHVTHSFSSGAFTKLGIMVFIISLGMHLIKERTQRQIEFNENEIKAKLAYTDGLTGLQNRLSFNNAEKVMSCGVQDCIIIQLDINDLKKVNDTYGHAEGDTHITSAANIIKKSFKLGDCYRTGGDEFIVIMNNGSEEELQEALDDMHRMIDKYNETEKPPVKLAIAYGYAMYEHRKDTFSVAEKLADERMYLKKREMKGERRKSVS